MKILVVGTGSIGLRHISNLMHFGVETAAFSYRATRDSSSKVPPNVSVVTDLDLALASDFDAVVIANRTDFHMEVALHAARLKKGIFIEKPISVSLSGIETLSALVETNRLVVEAGFMLRFHPNLIWIKHYLDGGSLGELMHLRASVGQWLPEWRPGSDYRTGYGAFRKTGGGVILDLIHELDLVTWLAGPVVDVCAMTRNVQCLEIETEAIAQICLKLTDGVLAQVHLDYVRPSYGRVLEIVGTKGILSWDYMHGTVMLTPSGASTYIAHQVPQEFERNTMFCEHMAHFLRRLSHPEIGAASSLEDSVSALRIALASHQSALERRNIRPQDVEHHFFEPKGSL